MDEEMCALRQNETFEFTLFHYLKAEIESMLWKLVLIRKRDTEHILLPILIAAWYRVSWNILTYGTYHFYPNFDAVGSSTWLDCVWKLKKSLYGLKQSGQNWNGLLHSYLIDQGFSQSLADCLHSIDHFVVWKQWHMAALYSSNISQ